MTYPLLPDRTWYCTDEQVTLSTAFANGDATAYHLGRPVAATRASASGAVDFGLLPAGGYGIDVSSNGKVVGRTAVEVRAPGNTRMRYGFIADYSPERSDENAQAVASFVRRMHLTHIQFYDWAYRHADLVGGGERYLDPLGQAVDLTFVRQLIGALSAAGTRSLGYAAVYGIGAEAWERWAEATLLDGAGTPYGIGDFLRIVDPVHPEWLPHLLDDLEAALAVGFDGFHLDQYGYPKQAQRADDESVDLAESFPEMLAEIRDRLTAATLVFNNVNDFPTRAMSSSPQDAVYIEPWEPNTSLASLANIVTRARAHTDLPIVLAAYQSVYAECETEADISAADRAVELTTATLSAHGATQLLVGGTQRLLIDPYYVNNAAIAHSTLEMIVRWADFLVEHDELLFDPAIADTTASTAGTYNDDLVVSHPEVPVEISAAAGTVWQRNCRAGDRHVVHLINLVGQNDTEWDAPRVRHTEVDGLTLRVRRGPHAQRVLVADPDGTGRLVELATNEVESHLEAVLPRLAAWQLIVVEGNAE